MQTRTSLVAVLVLGLVLLAGDSSAQSSEMGGCIANLISETRMPRHMLHQARRIMQTVMQVFKPLKNEDSVNAAMETMGNVMSELV